MSYLGWLDYSSGDRRRMLDVIELFRQKETVDELGIGSIRDTVADVLSPGTSTIQTRARYFFFIPWIYMDLEWRGVSADHVAQEARKAEVRLIDHLADSSDPDGTIGIEARESLKRLPSAVYWAGLKTMGIRMFDGAQDRYHRLFDQCRGQTGRHDDNGDLPEDSAGSVSWNPRLPKAPPGFPEGASLALTGEESAFMADRLAQQRPDSLLRFLVERRDVADNAGSPWEHPALDAMPRPLQQWLHHGRCFSELMYGAALLYNLMLARLSRADLVKPYSSDFQEWAKNVIARRDILVSWQTSEFWAWLRQRNTRLPIGAQDFSNNWIRMVLANSNPVALADSDAAQELVHQREWRLKGQRARLDSAPHRDLWGGASSAYRLDYRWRITQTIARDVIRGLEA